MLLKWSRFYVQLYIRLLQNFWIRRHECWKNHRAWSKTINNNRPNRKVTLSKEVTNGHERSQTILMGRAKLSENRIFDHDRNVEDLRKNGSLENHKILFCYQNEKMSLHTADKRDR